MSELNEHFARPRSFEPGDAVYLLDPRVRRVSEGGLRIVSAKVIQNAFNKIPDSSTVVLDTPEQQQPLGHRAKLAKNNTHLFTVEELERLSHELGWGDSGLSVDEMIEDAELGPEIAYALGMTICQNSV